MPAPKKQLIPDAKNYSRIMTLLEGGKSNVKIGDMREIRRKMVLLEASVILAGYKSTLAPIRADAQKLVKEFRKGNKSKQFKQALSTLTLTFSKAKAKPAKKVRRKKK